jgi:hypothetical protein
MTDERQQEQFKDAVERKGEEARQRSEQGGAPEGIEPAGGVQGDQESLTEHGRPQDVRSPRDKSSGHGKKTADKWNQ